MLSFVLIITTTLTTTKEKEQKIIDTLKSTFSISEVMAAHFILAGKQTGIDPLLLASLASTESNFKLKCVSSKGYKGIMQTKPATMKFADVDILHGARELESWIKYCKGDYYKAIAGYKGGVKPHKVAFRQAQRVLTIYKSIKT
jgi:hypothetical protein